VELGSGPQDTPLMYVPENVTCLNSSRLSRHVFRHNLTSIQNTKDLLMLLERLFVKKELVHSIEDFRLQ
jgi:hypothetical protein